MSSGIDKGMEQFFEEVENAVYVTLRQYGLDEWSVGFSKRKRVNGLCKYKKKVVELSYALVNKAEAEEINNTILHEIAHAIVGPRQKHNKIWQTKFLEIGGDGKRLGNNYIEDGYNWIRFCPDYHFIQRLYRKRKGHFLCPTCHKDIQWLSFSKEDYQRLRSLYDSIKE